ncbi:MAG: rhodanese-like domain-containing protein [Pseudohongiella sp.]|nr:rhodanese-like domain-containing protein [Pseudohongiella sp.]
MNKIIKRTATAALMSVMLLLLTPAISSAQSTAWSVLLEAAELSELLASNSSVRVIHVTGNFAEGHIPGAADAPYARFRGPQTNAGQLPSMQNLTLLLQTLGIEANTPVVIVHQGSNASDMGAATRVYWTLKSLGVQQLALLNGGFAAWREQQLPVSTVPSFISASGYQPGWNSAWQISAPALEQVLESPAMNLIDSRPASFYTGQQSVAVRPGTIRGADNLSYDTWFDNNRLKPLHELDVLFASKLPAQRDSLVTFCNTGHWASINWFVISELAGVPNTRMYAESVVDWAQSNRPMDNQPGRLSHYWSLTQEWMRSLTSATP